MNKKYSTLLTMGLLMAGSLCGVSAQTAFSKKYVGTAATEVTNGAKYILVQTDGATPTATELAFGFTNYDLDNKTVVPATVNLTTNVDGWTENAYKNFVWTVSESTSLGKTTVTFTNAATGLTLYVDNSGSTILTNYSLDKTNYSTEWAWTSDYKTYKKELEATTPQPLLRPGRASLTAGYGNYYDLATSAFSAATSAGTSRIILYNVKDVAASDAELNELYNTNGFNFSLTVDGVDNIFADQKVKAIKVGTNARKGTDVATSTLNDPLMGFPEGTYFAVSTPAGDYPEGSTYTADDRIDYLLNSTFIAVSPTDNATSDATIRKAGKGFKLTTVYGKDLNLFISTKASVQAANAAKMTSGAEVSVYNAAFNVVKNFEGNKYALSLGKIRYQEVAGTATHAEKDVKIEVMSDLNYVSGKTLATGAAGASTFIFKFAEPVVEKAVNLLSQDGAAIYNIMLASGRAYGAYLTDFGGAFYTKGQVLADLDAPAFQYMITNVNGTNVTFTNRETGKAFTAKLYKEDDGCYSLNMTSTNATVLDLNTSNNITTANYELNGAHIQLIPAASTDKFNGYWNVDSETLVTLAFARDFTPTSNKLYPQVDATVTGATTTYDLRLRMMTDDVTSAAQWQLVKDWTTPVTYKTATYAYLDANNKVVYKTKGDTVAVQPYKIQLIVDGNPEANHYLHIGTSNIIEIDPTPTLFYIKQNVDGSVTIESALNSNQFLAADGFTTVRNPYDWNRDMKMENIVVTTAKATDIKTYMIQDAPEISLPIETTFVTMKSEMGNYISMNEEQDGILVNIEPSTFKVFATDSAKAVPSFYVSFGKNEDGSRAFMFNPADSVSYYVGAGAYDKEYQWAEGVNKVIFKNAVLNETADTLTTSVKGKVANVAANADRYGTQAGLDKFKFQIVKVDPDYDWYVIRQKNAGYLKAINGKLTLQGTYDDAVVLAIENAAAPTANEAIEAAGVQVIGGQGVVTVQGAAGKVITIANILGQTIANQVATSDNVTIAAPAGVVVVAVDGEATKVVVK